MSTNDLKNTNLIALLGLEALADDKKIELLESARELVEKRLLVRILEALPESERETFIAAAEAGGSDTIASLIKTHVPNLMSIVEEETTKLKEELKHDADAAISS